MSSCGRRNGRNNFSAFLFLLYRENLLFLNLKQLNNLEHYAEYILAEILHARTFYTGNYLRCFIKFIITCVVLLSIVLLLINNILAPNVFVESVLNIYKSFHILSSKHLCRVLKYYLPNILLSFELCKFDRQSRIFLTCRRHVKVEFSFYTYNMTVGISSEKRL